MLVITEKQTPLVHFAWLFDNQSVFQKFEHVFFDQVATDAKSVSTFEKHPLMAELKLKMSQTLEENFWGRNVIFLRGLS